MAPATLQNCDEIADGLFLGGRVAAEEPEALIAQGIRAVVCCMREHEFSTMQFHPGLEYCRVDVEDMGREPIELFWPEAADFIHGFRSRGEAVLVHCRAGVSRSASTVLAYLVLRAGYSLSDAFALVRTRRQVITPNPGFMEKLCALEREELKLPASSVSIDRYLGWFSGEQSPDTLPDIKSDSVPPCKREELISPKRLWSGAPLVEDATESPSEGARSPASCDTTTGFSSASGEDEEDEEPPAQGHQQHAQEEVAPETGLRSRGSAAGAPSSQSCGEAPVARGGARCTGALACARRARRRGVARVVRRRSSAWRARTAPCSGPAWHAAVARNFLPCPKASRGRLPRKSPVFQR